MTYSLGDYLAPAVGLDVFGGKKSASDGYAVFAVESVTLAANVPAFLYLALLGFYGGLTAVSGSVAHLVYAVSFSHAGICLALSCPVHAQAH